MVLQANINYSCLVNTQNKLGQHCTFGFVILLPEGSVLS